MRTTYSRKFKLIYALVLALTFYVMLNPSFNHSQDYNRQVMAATGGQR